MFKDLDKKLELVRFLEQFKYIKRRVILPQDSNSNEDDAQHSWHLATMVLVLHHDYPDLDLQKCLIYALIHDIPEIYAGDTFTFDKEAVKSKKEREAAAIERIVSELDEENAKLFGQHFDEYENKSTPEARFVSQLDKIQAFTMNFMAEGQLWRKYGLTQKIVEDEFYTKITDEFGLLEIFEKIKKQAVENNWFAKE